MGARGMRSVLASAPALALIVALLVPGLDAQSSGSFVYETEFVAPDAFSINVILVSAWQTHGVLSDQ